MSAHIPNHGMRIGGETIGTDRAGERCIAVFNPFTGQSAASVPKATFDEVRRAIAIARACRPLLTRFERANILSKMAGHVRDAGGGRLVQELRATLHGGEAPARVCGGRRALHRPGGRDDASLDLRRPGRRQRRDGHGESTQRRRGPVSPIITFASIDEAIRIANGTAYGLSSAVCTNRLDDIARFVSEPHVGTVNVREVTGYRLELTPFGGIRDSGLGDKEGVREAMKSFTNVKAYSLPWV